MVGVMSSKWLCVAHDSDYPNFFETLYIAIISHVFQSQAGTEQRSVMRGVSESISPTVYMG